MRYSPINEDQWSALYSCAPGAAKIRDRCTRLVEEIAAVFSTRDLESVGLRIKASEPGPDDVFAQIDSPIGQGRLRLTWGVDDNGLVGILQVEKKLRTPEDKHIWLPTWGVTVPGSGYPYVGSGEGKLQVKRSFGQARDPLFDCGMSMLYAISVKPE